MDMFESTSSNQLLLKLKSFGLDCELLAVLDSWLNSRSAQVIVQRSFSHLINMQDKVYQGTVWGPLLWNIYFNDAKYAIWKAGCKDMSFADDINGYCMVPNAAPIHDLLALGCCQWCQF